MDSQINHEEHEEHEEGLRDVKQAWLELLVCFNRATDHFR
jgi:hypothetical protein